MQPDKESKSYQIDDNKIAGEDKKYSRPFATIFFILAAIAVSCFKFSILRLVVLYLSTICMLYFSFSVFKKNGYKLKKENLVGGVIAFIILLSLWLKFFGDLFISFIALLFSCFCIMALMNFEISEKIKLRAANYVFIGALTAAIILNWGSAMMIIHKIIK